MNLKTKITRLVSQKNFTLIISLLGVYLLSTGTSWAIFSFISDKKDGGSNETSGSRERIDPNLPKTEECPVNGKKFSKPERDIWEDRRPITAIIENHEEARPQSGLSYADVVYEAVAEGGITRFLSVFYCGASVKDIRIAPIRSARVYFIDWAAEYSSNPLFVHSGGANSVCGTCPLGVKPSSQVAREVDAFRILEKIGWRKAKGNAMDAGTNLGVPAVIRNQYRLGEKAAWEHSYEGFTDKIFDDGKARGFGYKAENGSAWDKNFLMWKFMDEKALASPKATEIKFKFWDNKSEYDVKWAYDSKENLYKRFNGDKEHTDHETKKQLTAKNIVVQFVSERGPVDKEGHMFYTTVGEGKAKIFQNGDVIEATWRKKTQFDRTMFFDSKSKEIPFIRGEIWIEAVPKGNEIEVN